MNYKKLTITNAPTTDFLSKPFKDEKNQVVFLSLGLFLVSNIAIILGLRSQLMKLFIYLSFFIFFVIFAYLLFGIRKHRKYMDLRAYSMLWFLLILGVFCILRLIPHQITKYDIRYVLFEGGAVIWMMPVALLYGLKNQFWFTWLPRLRVVVSLGFVFVLAVMLFRTFTWGRMYHSADFLFISAFLIIFSIYKPNKINISIGCMGVILLTVHMFLMDERFAIAYIGLMSIFYLLTILLEYHRLDLKVFLFYTGSILLLLSIFIAFNTSIFNTYITKYFVHGAMWEDSRADTRGAGTLSEAVTYGMSSFELAFGKGILGKYTWGTLGWPPVLYVRDNCEIGYKHIILKGGYVMWASFLILSIYAVYLGLFRSNNKITRYLSVIIISRLIIMYTAMPPRANFEYFMYWIVVGGCLSTQLRALDDAAIKNKSETNPLIIRW